MFFLITIITCWAHPADSPGMAMAPISGFLTMVGYGYYAYHQMHGDRQPAPRVSLPDETLWIIITWTLSVTAWGCSVYFLGRCSLFGGYSFFRIIWTDLTSSSEMSPISGFLNHVLSPRWNTVNYPYLHVSHQNGIWLMVMIPISSDPIYW